MNTRLFTEFGNGEVQRRCARFVAAYDFLLVHMCRVVA